MNYEEYKAEFEKLVKEPDSLTAKLPDLMDKLKTDLETRESLQAQLQTAETKIRTLQDTNTELFLRVTSAPQLSATIEKVDPIESLMAQQFKEGRPI